MLRPAAFVLTLALSVAISGCKKKPQDPEQGPGGPHDRNGPGGPGGPNERHDPNDPNGPGGPNGPSGPEGEGPDGPSGASGAPTLASGSTAPSAPAAPTAALADDPVWVPPAKLLPGPEEGFLVLVRAAEQRCRRGDNVCPERDQLASRLPVELDQVKDMLQKGTDQQKRTLRDALLRSTDPSLDELLVAGVVAADGGLERTVLVHAQKLTTPKLVAPLLAFLEKATGPDVNVAVDALSRLPAAEWKKWVLGKLLAESHRPYSGALCRAVARQGLTEAKDAVVQLGSAPNAGDAQLLGCRGAEATFQVRASGTPLTYNVEGRQLPVAAVLVTQDRNDPTTLVLGITATPKASCASMGTIDTVLRVPMDRDAKPIVGRGLVPRLVHQQKDLGDAQVFHLSFDALETKRNAPVSGVVHVAHIVSGEPHVVVSGHFTGQYCGAR